MSGLNLPTGPGAKERRFRARRQQIMDIAVDIAEREGWEAVTTRRLAQAIDYSQPVIYQHFANRDDLLRSIAIEGFAALSDQVEAVAKLHTPASLEDLCRTYLQFARDNPGRYEVMFSVPTSIPFDSPDTPAAPQQAFTTLRDLITQNTDPDPDATTEFFWAACHGLASLLAAGRIPKNRLETHIQTLGRLSTVK